MDRHLQLRGHPQMYRPGNLPIQNRPSPLPTTKDGRQQCKQWSPDCQMEACKNLTHTVRQDVIALLQVSEGFTTTGHPLYPLEPDLPFQVQRVI